jgi:hypothetical protein
VDEVVRAGVDAEMRQLLGHQPVRQGVQLAEVGVP